MSKTIKINHLVRSYIAMRFILLNLLFAIIFLGFTKRHDDTKKLNVLFITIDDLRPELGCYGSTRVKTPNIDQLAQNSALFKNAYCNSAVCGPSRASLLTGVRPIPNKRFKDWNCRADIEAKNIVSMPEYLKNAGYHTISNGKIMHVQDDSPSAWSEPAWRSGGNRGAGFHDYNIYNDWLDTVSVQFVKDKKGPFCEQADVDDHAYHDGEICDKTIEDLRRMAQSKQPFFIATGFWRPHLPFNAPKKYWDLYKREDITLATNRFFPKNAPSILKTSKEILGQYTANEGFPEADAFHRKAIHGYLASVSYVDALVGKIVQELKNLGLWENTIIVLLGDHGFHLGEHNFWGKHNTMNCSVNAPLLIRHPQMKAQFLKQNVEFVDIYPTISEMLTLRKPVHCVGKSLLSIIKNPKKAHKPYVFTMFENAYAIKSGDLLYTEWDEGKTRMLYDHKTDPQENTNVAHQPQYNKRVDVLRKQLILLRKNE
jgi:iduronate 2-sulfatase